MLDRLERDDQIERFIGKRNRADVCHDRIGSLVTFQLMAGLLDRKGGDIGASDTRASLGKEQRKLSYAATDLEDSQTRNIA